jgi:hypothetical protein
MHETNQKRQAGFFDVPMPTRVGFKSQEQLPATEGDWMRSIKIHAAGHQRREFTRP